MDALFIDIGSNTIKSLLARFENGRIIGLANATVAKRISADNSLVPDAAEIIYGAVRELSEKAAGISGAFETVCFGTSALRDFADAGPVLASLSAKGVKVRVLSGEEEAAYSFRGAMTDDSLEIMPGEKFMYADLGGGSMEFACGCSDGAEFAKSLPIGAVRLTKMFGRDYAKTAAFCADRLSEIPEPSGAFRLVIAGGAVTAARYIIGRGSFSESPLISMRDMGAALETALNEDTVALSENYGVPPNRADILPAAFVCLVQTLKRFGKNEFTHTQHSLRCGVAAEYFLDGKGGFEISRFR